MEHNDEEERDIAPLQDPIFIKIMDGIVAHSHHKKSVLTSARALVNKEEDPVPYYTLDSAICYMTYTEVQQRPDTEINQRILERLAKRVKTNMITMEKEHKRKN